MAKELALEVGGPLVVDLPDADFAVAARGYDAWVLRKKDFSEDKRKNAHVTGLIGINQTSEEKQFGIYRLNWVALRDGKWSDSQVIWTAGNLAVANPCMVSTL